MSIFAVELMEEVKGSKHFYRLIVDDVCLLDAFEKELNGGNCRYNSEYRAIVARMQMVSENNLLPKELLNTIRFSGAPCHCCEFKSKHLRVYVFVNQNAYYVVMGGFKTNQDKDIKRFSSIVIEYFSQLNQSNQ